MYRFQSIHRDKKIIILSAIFFVVLLIVSCRNETEERRTCVIDNAHLLTDEQQSKLIEEILELETNIGSQLAVLTIVSLEGEKIEDYSLRIANTWGLGRKEHDDGVLITVALHDRQARIEVGYGLEKIITDALADQILAEHIVPNFRNQNYYEGLSLAIGKIKTLIEDHKHLVGQRVR
jgi:uncharacterized protein